MGASRWLDAKRLDGISRHSTTVRVTMVFSRCIRFSSRLDFGGRCQSWAKKVEELPRPRFATGKSSSLYRYGLDAGTDFFRAGIFITSAFALAGLSISLLGGKRWEAGSDRVSGPEWITSEPWLARHFSSRAKWRSSPSARWSVLQNCLTP